MLLIMNLKEIVVINVNEHLQKETIVIHAIRPGVAAVPIASQTRIKKKYTPWMWIQ
jgi:hypothetical protein